MKQNRYYTTNSAYRILTAMIFFTPFNLLLCELLETYHPIWLLIPIALLQGYIFGMAVGYIQFGTTAPIRKKLPGITLCVILFYLLLSWNWEKGMYCISTVLLLFYIFWALWYLGSAKNFAGNNSHFAEDDIDTSWFDFVYNRLSEFSVLFPLDIGNYKKDRTVGHIMYIGLATAGKYAGQPVALITSKGKQYLCLLSQIIPNQYQNEGEVGLIDMRTQKRTVIIGIKETECGTSFPKELICEVLFQWYQYGEGCSVSYRTVYNL
jgi:hypothetical protein